MKPDGKSACGDDSYTFKDMEEWLNNDSAKNVRVYDKKSNRYWKVRKKEFVWTCEPTQKKDGCLTSRCVPRYKRNNSGEKESFESWCEGQGFDPDTTQGRQCVACSTVGGTWSQSGACINCPNDGPNFCHTRPDDLFFSASTGEACTCDPGQEWDGALSRCVACRAGYGSVPLKGHGATTKRVQAGPRNVLQRRHRQNAGRDRYAMRAGALLPRGFAHRCGLLSRRLQLRKRGTGARGDGRVPAGIVLSRGELSAEQVSRGSPVFRRGTERISAVRRGALLRQ